MFCIPLFVFLILFCLPLYCLAVDLKITNTHLVFSNSSDHRRVFLQTNSKETNTKCKSKTPKRSFGGHILSYFTSLISDIWHLKLTCITNVNTLLESKFQGQTTLNNNFGIAIIKTKDKLVQGRTFP